MDWSDQTLDQLETVEWGKPTFSSYVVTNSHRLRTKPLRDFTPEDLRFMIGQQISLPSLVPMALDVLEREPFSSGDMYPGALLSNTLKADPSFWQAHPELWYRLNVVVADIDSMARTLEEELLPAASAFLAARPT